MSSLASGGIYRVMPHSTEAKLWIEPGTFGTHSTFGVLVQEKAGILWVCSNDLSAGGMTVGNTDGVSALFAFDLKTGAATAPTIECIGSTTTISSRHRPPGDFWDALL